MDIMKYAGLDVLQCVIHVKEHYVHEAVSYTHLTLPTILLV